MTKYEKDLERIIRALHAGGEIYRSRSLESVRVDRKSGGDPVTDAEREVNQLLFEMLVQSGEGWLSEESADNADRLTRSRVWLVDPLDGTKEYVSGIPEWCISIALMEEGRLVAAGVLNPCTDEMFYGSVETGVTTLNGSTKGLNCEGLSVSEPLVLGSRSEFKRGEWERFRVAKFRIQPMGSVAYKLALVAAGKADATWTLVPKHEWDVAAGVALVLFSGGVALCLDGQPPRFNQRNPIFSGLIGFSVAGTEKLRSFLGDVLGGPAFEDCRPWARVVIESVTNA
ncbi:MAG: 3'(2'),5'-bisphosphate nucleotidase CysQ [Candidatus Acidiferrales bacterium]